MIAKRHGCGHKIWVEFQWTGHRYAPVYRDNEEESPTVGEYTDCCPTCAEFLSMDVLLTENDYFNGLDECYA